MDYDDTQGMLWVLKTMLDGVGDAPLSGMVRHQAYERALRAGLVPDFTPVYPMTEKEKQRLLKENARQSTEIREEINKAFWIFTRCKNSSPVPKTLYDRETELLRARFGLRRIKTQES